MADKFTGHGPDRDTLYQLIALDLDGGPRFVEELRRAWDDGDAVFPVDRRLPASARDAVLTAIAPTVVVTADGRFPRLGRPVEPGTALVVATSGTTGEPKGVVLSHRAVTASARATSARLGVAAEGHWLACLPLNHVGGLSVVTRALATGAGLSVHPGFDVAAVEAAARGGATLVSLVATALARLDAGLFDAIVLGGGHPPLDPPANAVITYGMTETGSGVVYDGVPLDGVDVRLSCDGEIWLRGAMLLDGYRCADGQHVDPKDAEGWLATGDLGSWQADGRLHVAGRRGELIITGGENVWPEAVERALTGCPGIADVAVCGVNDEEWGQVVTAMIVPGLDGAPTLEGVRGWSRERLAPYAAPRRLVVIEAVPRTPLGKIRRGEVARLAAASFPD